jgi:hypothetical protein
MQRTFAAACLVLVMCVSIHHPGHADGVLGKRHVGIEAGVIRPGDEDIRDIDSAVLLFGSGLNYPVKPNLDISLSVGYDILKSRYGGLRITSFGIVPGAIYHFAPDKKYNPFVGGEIGYIITRVKAGFGDSEDLGWAVGGGVELDLIDSAALTPSVAFTKVDDVEDFSLNVTLNNWFSDRMGGVVNLGYGTDEGDFAASGGVLLAF